MKFLLAQILLCVCVLVFVGCASSNKPTGTVEVIRVWPDYRTAESFERISEYFTDKENPSGQITLRTQPGSRAGYYFFMRFKTPADIAGARVVIDVITPASAEPKTFTFDMPLLRAGSVQLNPGLTGSDWPDATARPTAWRLRLLASDGAEIFAQQSYLWSK